MVVHTSEFHGHVVLCYNYDWYACQPKITEAELEGDDDDDDDDGDYDYAPAA